ncbi:MAG: hypothetical protein AAF108_07405 [Planctomycetota bacterium]
MTRHRAFTAMESLVSLAAVAVVVLALGAALTVTARAAASAPADARFAEAVAAVERLSNELSTAHLVTEVSGEAIEFVAADTTGDLRPDLVRYEWSTTPGDPLLRAVNGQDPTPVVAAVNDLSFAPSDAAPLLGPSLTLQTVVEGRIRVAKPRTLDDYGDDKRLAHSTQPATAAVALKPGQATRQRLDPFFLANASTTITRLRVRALQAGPPDATLNIRIVELAPNNVDVQRTLFETDVHERLITGHGFDWLTLDIAGAETDLPKQLAVEIRAEGPPDADAARLLLTNEPEDTSGRSNSSSANVFTPAQGTLALELFGAHPASKAEVAQTLRAVRIKLAATGVPSRLIDTTTYLVNTEITP